jgi:hypothetical protein
MWVSELGQHFKIGSLTLMVSWDYQEGTHLDYQATNSFPTHGFYGVEAGPKIRPLFLKPNHSNENIHYGSLRKRNR